MTIDNKSKYISRKFYRRLMTEIGNNQYDPTKYIKDKIIISVDCLSTKKIVKTNEVKVRKLEDIVSQQFLLGYNGKVMYYLSTREQTDSPFDFWDLAMVIKDFLQQIGYEKHYTAIDYEKLATKFSMKVDEVRKYSGKLKIPKLIMVGYLLGDTISSYKNWQSYIDTSKLENQDKDKYVSMYQNALTSYNFVPFSIASPDYKRRAFLEIKLRDNIALTSAQDDLETLAKMFDITITRNNCDEKFSSLAEYIWKNHQKFSDSVLTNYMYLGFISKQVEDIYNAGLTDRFILPARLSELGDRISDHFFQMPYNSKQVKKVIDDIFLNDNVENYLRPQEYKYSLKKGELRKWKKLISKISGQSDEHLRLQDTMLQNIESYLARGAISYKVASDGKPYRKFNKNNIFNKIDLDSLYRNNPELEPSDLITSDISLNPKKYVIDIPNTLRRNYRKNKQKFKRDYYSNEPERIETLIEGLWKSSAYNMAYKKIGGKIKLFSTSTNYYFKQKIDFKYTRNGFHFMKTSNKYNKAQKNMHTIRVNQATNSGFEVARLAFKGGINQAYDHGLISEYKYLYSPDLKSSYPMAGSFIPDFRTDITPLKDESDVSLKEFNKKIRPKLPNGDFTLGICICSYETSDNLKRVPVGVKSNFEDSSPYYVKSADNVEMTLTDAINLINTGVKSMYFNRIIIPHQKILDGSEESLCPVSRAQHWGLKQREMAIEKYGTESPEEKIFKLFVNLQFGKSGQGLLPKEDHKYINFSRSTNPYIADQFTSVTRYLINALANAFEKSYPGSLIPSITTDGMCLCTNEPVDINKVNEFLREKYSLWSQIVDKWFNGTFFKFKSKLSGDNKKFSVDTPLINLKTRFNFSLDGRIKAMAGISNGDFQKVYESLCQGEASFLTESVRKTSLKQLKIRTNLKHLQAEWKQNIYQNLGYDDSNKVIGFHETENGLVHYVTEPFDTVEELLATKNCMKPYRRLFPFMKVEYARELLKLDNSLVQTKQGLKIKWVTEDVLLKDLKYLGLFPYYEKTYMPKVLLRFLAENKEHYDMKKIYQELFNEQYKTFSGFNQAVKRADNKFVNPFVVLKEDWTQKFKKYELK